MHNQQWLLDNRPTAEATATNFKLVTTDNAALQDGQVLVRHHFMSLDPYMRGRMNESKSYAAAQPLGEVMIGGTAGEVVASKNTKFAVGDKVRIALERNRFTKGDKPRFSNETHTIRERVFNRYLVDGKLKKYLHNELLKTG